MNRVILVGRLTKDPEIRYTNSNIPVAQFTLAVNRRFAGQNGERQADFINCVVWRQQAENLGKFIKKGGLIGVEGQIQTRTYDEPNGQRRYITEVVCDSISFLEPKGATRGGGAYDVNQYDIPAERSYSSHNQQSQYSQPQQKEIQKDPFEDLVSDYNFASDDLPF